MKRLIPAIIAASITSTCFAQMGQVKVSGSASTNTSSTAIGTIEGNGLIYRAVLTVTGGTADVVIASSDGTALISTNNVSGSLTLTPSTPLAAVGVVLKTANAIPTNTPPTAAATITILK